MRVYAGIGNRDISENVKGAITALARGFYLLGYQLRSGGAIGADQAFERGHLFGSTVDSIRKENATEEAIELASNHHPRWDLCKPNVRRLHGRNAMIIMGRDLKTPVDFVLCWAVDEEHGGTALGIRIARAHNIPVINLAKGYNPPDGD